MASPKVDLRFSSPRQANIQWQSRTRTRDRKIPAYIRAGGIGGTVFSEPTLRHAARTLLSRVRAPPPAPWPQTTLLYTGCTQNPNFQGKFASRCTSNTF
ncbi:hypothetical protein PoB_004695800 [Plakobranchus ocellatus]|uniref:Uncharacterized protein n=1 Tax=Plakobranchus ocellatus TaxID=259542 RepID=A0AAV4BLL7_9GAST|nr:hypothetical protein PoB_004695800 [Plakobranchus ocellatus]